MTRNETNETKNSVRPEPEGEHREPEPAVDRERRIFLDDLRAKAMLFIRLRWLVSPLIVVSSLAAWKLGFGFHLTGAMGVAVFVLAYNIALHLVSRRSSLLRAAPRWLHYFTNSQVLLDFSALFALVYATGGVASPLIFFFIFHIVFASILMSRRSSLIFAGVVVGGTALMFFGDLTQVIPYQNLSYKGDEINFPGKPWYLASLFLFFTSAIAITAISTSAIMRMLRKHSVENALVCEEMRSLSEERWRFMLKVAHNSRAPLSAMLSMLDVIRHNYLGPLSPPQEEHMRRIDRRARSMAGMIDDMLLLTRSRMGFKPASPSPMTIEDIAGRVARTFEDEARQKGLGFKVDVPREILGVTADMEVIEPILENLLSNAIKYTEQGEVDLAFAISNRQLTIRISDTGIGVPKEDLPKLFSEFYRARNAKKKEAIGNGLGLALVKETVKQNGGTIEFESEEGKGTLFEVTLPL